MKRRAAFPGWVLLPLLALLCAPGILAVGTSVSQTGSNPSEYEIMVTRTGGDGTVDTIIFAHAARSLIYLGDCGNRPLNVSCIEASGWTPTRTASGDIVLKANPGSELDGSPSSMTYFVRLVARDKLILTSTDAGYVDNSGMDPDSTVGDDMVPTVLEGPCGCGGPGLDSGCVNPCVPAVSTVGMAVLALLLMVLGTLCIVRWRRTQGTAG